ncbi:MAG: hypothetical protein R3F24_03465 [Gammaproteobacteria bacterium]
MFWVIDVGGISDGDKKTLDTAAYAAQTAIGKGFAERSFEAALHGTSGHEDVVVNARTQNAVADRVPSLPGRDVILTIDLKTQLAADTALQGWRGAAVAIDPHNGEVLALASTPAYDLNAISVTQLPGISCASADIDSLFNCTGARQYPLRFHDRADRWPGCLHYGVMTLENVASPRFLQLFLPAAVTLP